MTKRPEKRAVMFYLDAKVYDQLKQQAAAHRPPTKPGPLAAEILRAYFEDKNGEQHEIPKR